MKKKFIVLTLMVTFLGTVVFAQNIYSPSNGDVIEIPAGTATTANVCISYNNNINGVPQNYCYNIYVNGMLHTGTTLISPICLSLSPGTYTIMVEYCYNSNPNPNSNSSWIVMDFSSVTFTVVKVPTIIVTASAPSITPGGSVTFFATCDMPHSPYDFEWDINLSGGWVTDVESGNSITISGPLVSLGRTIIARAHILFNGRKVYSYGVGVPVR